MDIFKLGDKILALLEMVFGFWNNQISLVFSMLGQSPVNFKGGGPWAIIEGIEPIFVAVGSSLVVLFFVIGFCSESVDVKEEMRFESILRMLIRLALAEWFVANNAGIQVIGCPKTIDGDLKNDDIECSFGFDTATKTYSELIGNIQRDANSAKKYWHFIKVMGRSASHVALECALETQPNICLISEEVAAKKMSLSQIANYIADSVEKRAAKGMNFGVAIIPEGVVEFVPEFSVLIHEINELLAGSKADAFNALANWQEKYAFIEKGLTKESMAVFALLPEGIQQQLFLERDPHGNVQVSLIESEKLFAALVKDVLAERKQAGTYKGKFNALPHFFGYEGRCAFPSNFDADYCYSLGYNAFMLIQYGYTGYLSKVSNLSKPAEEWVAGGMPITKMMNIERRHGEDKPVIRKALVELDGKPFKYFEANRDEWAVETCYTYPGAIQYYGPAEVCDLTTRTLALEKEGK